MPIYSRRLPLFITLVCLAVPTVLSAQLPFANPFEKGRVIFDVDVAYSASDAEMEVDASQKVQSGMSDFEIELGYTFVDNLILAVFFNHQQETSEIDTEFFVQDNERRINSYGLATAYVFLPQSRVRPAVEVSAGLGNTDDIENERFLFPGAPAPLMTENRYDVKSLGVTPGLWLAVNTHFLVGASYQFITFKAAHEDDGNLDTTGTSHGLIFRGMVSF